MNVSARDLDRLEGLRVGKLTPTWVGSMLVLAGLVCWALYAAYRGATEGLIITGMRTPGQGGASWGLYIVFEVYFIGLSFAGISVSAMARLFAMDNLRPLARMAETLTIICLAVGALFIVVDLGRPLEGLLYLPQFARPWSPFFGTFTLVLSGYLFATLVYLYLEGRPDAALCADVYPRARLFYRLWASGYRGTEAEAQRHERTSFWLSLTILPLLVIAHSTLGFVFGIVSGRPGWFSALQAPSFVVLAGSSGIGALAVLAIGLRRSFGLQADIRASALRVLALFVWGLTLAYLYLIAVEELTATYASGRAEAGLAAVMVEGRYGFTFWTMIGCFVGAVALLFPFVFGPARTSLLVSAGILVNIAAILKRYLIVVPSQTHGMLLPYATGAYVPSIMEVAVVVGFCALVIALFRVFMKTFPIVPIVPEPTILADCDPAAAGAGSPAGEPGLWVRRVAFWGTLASGLTLAVVGLLLSGRVGRLAYEDPAAPFSPMIFILGVMLTFYSAAVYEIFPWRRAARSALDR